jgi:tetraacyldisaccharide 4'-kinase
MINFLRILLLPVSLVYLIIIIVRNILYNRNIFKSYKISKPVISVGNISTGGTGKSPFVILLTKFLMKQNIIPAILSRGYKRKSNVIETVYNGSEITSTIDKCGDEPMMIANDLSSNFKNFFIATGSNRTETAKYIIDKYNADVIILDDAFQHRKIKRDLDIVLIDAEEIYKNILTGSLLIPSGNLRENLGNLNRANIIIQNNKFNNFEILKILKKCNKEIFVLNYSVKGFYNINNIEYDINEKDICAFAGIAKPASFFTKLKEYNCNFLDSIVFRDHHNYSLDDISKITLNASKETLFVTTEKDFVKIQKFNDFIKYFNVLFMKIELNLNENDRFFALVKNVLKNNESCNY